MASRHLNGCRSRRSASRLDAFEWKQPVSQIAGPIEEGTPDAADAAIRSLPPVAIVHQRPEPRPEPAATPVKASPVVEAEDKAPAPVKTIAVPTPSGSVDRAADGEGRAEAGPSQD